MRLNPTKMKQMRVFAHVQQRENIAPEVGTPARRITAIASAPVVSAHRSLAITVERKGENRDADGLAEIDGPSGRPSIGPSSAGQGPWRRLARAVSIKTALQHQALQDDGERAQRADRCISGVSPVRGLEGWHDEEKDLTRLVLDFECSTFI